jgi:hypothetical protein
MGHARRERHSAIDNSTGSVQPYLDLVRAYGWGNYMFQTNRGSSFPAHQFLFGATSAPSAADDHKGILASDAIQLTGCVAPSTASASDQSKGR